MSKEERIATGTNARPERYLRVAAFLLLAASVVMLGFILLLLASREWMAALGVALAGLGFLLAGASIGKKTSAVNGAPAPNAAAADPPPPIAAEYWQYRSSRLNEPFTRKSRSGA